MPLFSVIIATRNRPDLFQKALDSVLAQTCADIEIIVVDDGSGADQQSRYKAILDAADAARVRSFRLPARPHGHGGSYARNYGVTEASAPYLCFLDDDDTWTDPHHLQRAQTIIAGSNPRVDLYLTDQAAFLQGNRLPGPIWIEDLPPILARFGNRPDHYGSYIVTAEILLQASGFSHLNTLIVRTDLFRQIGGLDEKNSWEEDRDLYLRLIDCASMIKYCPVTVAHHNVPNAKQHPSITTAHSEFERRLSQLRLLDRAILSSRHPDIRAYARRHKAYTLKKISASLAAEGRVAEAAFYAREALGAGPTIKWAVYTGWCMLQAILERLWKWRQPPTATAPKSNGDQYAA